MQDGTVAVEADVSHALVQWPFLTDISFVWAAASIFQPEAATGALTRLLQQSSASVLPFSTLIAHSSAASVTCVALQSLCSPFKLNTKACCM